jgi:Rod binding domain-containing protein
MYVNSGQMTDLLNLAQTEKFQNAKKDKELQKVCADFESVLLNYMFQAMKKTVGDGGLFGDSFRKDMYESLFFEKISQKFAEARGVGIGEALYRQLSAKTKGSGDGGHSVRDAAEPAQQNEDR